MSHYKTNLTNNVFGNQVYVFDKLDSTNTHLLENFNDYDNWSVVIAKNQTKGKGRLGKQWIDLPNSTLSMSILLKPFLIQYTQVLPLMCGLCVRSALEKLSGNSDIKVKWSNDIVVYGKKLCGILCESRIMGDKMIAVIGCGVNINQPQSFFSQNNLDYGTSIKILSGKEFSFQNVAKLILIEFNEMFPIFIKYGFSYYQEQYNKYCVNIGNYVNITTPTNTITGVAKEIDEQGNMVVESNGQLIKINSGESSVRGIYGYY